MHIQEVYVHSEVVCNDGIYQEERFLLDRIATFEISDEITMYLSEVERKLTVFYNDIEFVVRMNSFVADTIENMYEADPARKIFLLQVLKSLEIKEDAEL